MRPLPKFPRRFAGDADGAGRAASGVRGSSPNKAMTSERRWLQIRSENKRLRTERDVARRELRLVRVELASQKTITDTWRRLAVSGPRRCDDSKP